MRGYLVASDTVLFLGVLGAPSCANKVFNWWNNGRTVILALVKKNTHYNT